MKNFILPLLFLVATPTVSAQPQTQRQPVKDLTTVTAPAVYRTYTVGDNTYYAITTSDKKVVLTPVPVEDKPKEINPLFIYLFEVKQE